MENLVTQTQAEQKAWLEGMETTCDVLQNMALDDLKGATGFFQGRRRERNNYLLDAIKIVRDRIALEK